MKSTLEQARTEVARIIQHRNDTYAGRIQSGELHRDVAKRQYNRLRLISFALHVMTPKEWQDLQQRYLKAKAQQLRQGQLKL